MAPARPNTFTAGEDHVERFGGGAVFDWVQPKHGSKVGYDESFRFHAHMRPFKGIYKKHMEANTKPPMHFHRYQWEYFDVIGEGELTVEVDGVAKPIRKDDPGVYIRPYSHHVVYGTPGVQQDEIDFIVSSEDTRKGDALTNRRLDRLFFENWYGYQEDVFRVGGKFDLLQVLSMFDAGDTYMTLPWWVPMRCTVAILMGIVLGRWIGGLLGYQPFYPEWSTDWDVACASMKKTRTQARFAKRDAPVEARKRFIKNGVFSPNL